MGESAARRARRQREQREARQTALQAVPDTSSTEAGPAWQPDEVNFMLVPGGLLQPEGSPPLSEKPKTVRVPGPLAVHIAHFHARHGAKRYSFDRASRAMWRLLLREEHNAMEAAKREAAVTGVPAQPKMGPLYLALREELELMRREESGEIFDED